MKLLTEEEYREQSNAETRRALEDLRRCTLALVTCWRPRHLVTWPRYCQSPTSNPWKTVTRVADPSRWILSQTD